MTEAITYFDMVKDLKSKYKNKNKTFAIILSKPNKSQVSDEILNNLSYFHHRALNKLDIYLPGNGASFGRKYVDIKNICNIDNVDWSFSSKCFSDFIEEMEKMSSWHYNGGSEIILLDFEKDKIKFSNVVRVKLDRALKDGAINSVEEFIEKIIGIFIKCDDNSTFKISDTLTLNELGKSIANELSERFSILKFFKRSRHYTIYNYEKKE